MSAESDRVLIAAIRAGGDKVESAWEDLIHRFEGRLRAYVRRRLRDHATADDVVQDTFIGFINSLSNYDDRRDLQTWLFTIASHKVTDQLRKIGRRPFQTGSDADAEQLVREADVKQRAASSIARTRERRELEVEAVIRGLRDLLNHFRQKSDYKRIQVLELLFVKGWPNWHVAKHLEITEQQVANYRFAAVKKLSESMKASGMSIDVFPELHADADPAAQ